MKAAAAVAWVVELVARDGALRAGVKADFWRAAPGSSTSPPSKQRTVETKRRAVRPRGRFLRRGGREGRQIQTTMDLSKTGKGIFGYTWIDFRRQHWNPA